MNAANSLIIVEDVVAVLLKTHLLFVIYANNTARIHAIIVLTMTEYPIGCATTQ
jgi:hypothetical protein